MTWLACSWRPLMPSRSLPLGGLVQTCLPRIQRAQGHQPPLLLAFLALKSGLDVAVITVQSGSHSCATQPLPECPGTPREAWLSPRVMMMASSAELCMKRRGRQ